MLGYLFLLFTIVPLVELAMLIWIGGQTAWWVPVLMVLASGVAGAVLARWQGWRAIERIRDEMREGRIPADAVVDGVLVLVAGLLLITPGVMTDVIGIVLLVPPLRRALKRGVVAWLMHSVKVRTMRFTTEGGTPGEWSTSHDESPESRAQIIDAHVIETRVEDAP